MKKLKVGRPELEENQRKKSNLKVRLLEDDIEKLRKLHSASASQSISEMIRQVLFKQPIEVQLRGITEVRKEVVQIKAYLTKLNKKAEFAEASEEFEKLRSSCDEIYSILKDLPAYSLSLEDCDTQQQGNY